MMDIRKISEADENPVLSICLDTLKLKKQALVFVSTKRSAEKTAEDISRKVTAAAKSGHHDAIMRPISEKESVKLSELILNDLSRPTKQCIRLAKVVKRGIAFHHAGLTSNQKSLIEDAFRKGSIKIISCTPTLAAGLDLPAFRTIIRDLKRFTARGMQNIPVLEYLQMAGRAGRPGYEDYGEAICIAQSDAEKDEIISTYLFGEPEDIYSKLAVEPVLRTYLLSLISTRIVRTKEDILHFFSDTFWAHQFKDMYRLEMIIDKMLEYLKRWEFIRAAHKDDERRSFEHEDERKDGAEDQIEGFSSAYDMIQEKGRKAKHYSNKKHDEEIYKPTYLGKRVSELYLDPYTAHILIKGLRKSSETSKDASAFALLQLVCNTLEIRPQLKVKTREIDEIQGLIVKHEDEFLQNEPSIYEPEYEEYLNSVKTAACLYEWIEEISEEYLLERYAIRPGELKVKIDTADWLLYAASELAHIQHYKPVLKEIMKLRIRLKHGAKEELLALLKLKGIGRVRARKLYSNGIKDIRDIKAMDSSVLAQLVGRSLALSIKEQVGEDISKIRIKQRKRKGQINLNDYC